MRETFIDRETRSIANLSLLPNGEWELSRISVPAPHRGKGIGRRLMAEVLAEVDAAGVDLYLDINPYGDMDYKALAAWYARLGFRKQGVRWRREPR